MIGAAQALGEGEGQRGFAAGGRAGDDQGVRVGHAVRTPLGGHVLVHPAGDADSVGGGNRV